MFSFVEMLYLDFFKFWFKFCLILRSTDRPQNLAHFPPAANMPRLNPPLGKPADAMLVRQPPVLTRCATHLDPYALLVRREPCLDVVRILTHHLSVR